jgi:hypothetical protein
MRSAMRGRERIFELGYLFTLREAGIWQLSDLLAGVSDDLAPR